MKVRKNSNYLQQTSNEVKISSEVAGISFEEGCNLIDDYFSIVSYLLNDERMPRVYLPYIGSVGPTFGSIRRSLSLTFSLLKKDKITRDIALYRIKKFWPIRRRLVNEKFGKETFVHWIGIPYNWQKEGMPELYQKAFDWYTRGGKNKFDQERGIYKGRFRPSKIDLVI